ncbi:3-hydroxyacyl-CoA dehydrogenase family protein [Streptomyces noursei]|uniref:3-hydroxyacyl-CoA dehydrogenase family protein n=1 Tax=Streptomyces noursei TaxID=1971 RepID=UPI002155A080|nr:3-hydroxyacyl-CoA dehydrogenase family protein [Streptomyces noursei]
MLVPRQDDDAAAGDPAEFAMPSLATGERVAVFAATEEEAGTELGRVRTAVDEDGDDVVVTGHKRWVTFGQTEDDVLVLGMHFMNPATVLEEGTADGGTVDRVFQGCFGHARGPLRTADLIGLDTVLDSLHVLLECTADRRYTPCALLTDLVQQSHVGRKGGRGFHTYVR